MSRSWRVVLPFLVLAGAGVLVMAVVGALTILRGGTSGKGCSEPDERFAATLDALAILSLHPSDAAPTDRYSGCDADDGFAYAGRRYSAPDQEKVVTFYKDSVPRKGWKLLKEDPAPVPKKSLVISGAHLCFSRQVDRTTVYLSVWFPSDFGEQTTDYGLEVTGSHDGAAWC